MSNGSTELMKMTAGMDLGDNYSHLCLIDTESGELIKVSRLPHHLWHLALPTDLSTDT